MSTSHLAALVVAACLVTWGCDQAPGPREEAGTPPIVSDLSFTPKAYGVPHDAGEGPISIPVALSVAVADVDGDLETVSFVVQPPVAGADPVDQGELVRAGSRYAAQTTLTLPSGAVGAYTVLVYAVDAEGELSNDVRGILLVQGAGEPPVIEGVDADPEIVRPPTTLTLVATVRDPDGAANIATVEGTTPRGQTFRLFDDGATLGDEVAGDGRFTARFDVPEATPGTQVFTFVATDLSGLQSDVFSKEIVVE